MLHHEQVEHSIKSKKADWFSHFSQQHQFAEGKIQKNKPQSQY